MLPEKPATETRRKRHLLRWTFVVFAIVFGWGGWRYYDFRQAVKEAKERGWWVEYHEPIAVIRADWRAAFRKETWSGTERHLFIHADTVSERDFDLVRRLKPKQLSIEATFPWPDFSLLKGLSNLTALVLHDSPNLTNVDALKDMKELTGLGIDSCPVLVNIDALKELHNLTDLDIGRSTALTNLDALRELKALEDLAIYDCTGLKNVDGLHVLTRLRRVDFLGCTGLTKEAVEALKAALPKTKVSSDYE